MNNLETLIFELYKEICLKKIQDEGISGRKYDLTFSEYKDIIRKYFDGPFFISATSDYLRVYSVLDNSLVFEIQCVYILKTSCFIPVLLKYNNKIYFKDQALDSTFKELQLRHGALYFLYENTSKAFEKYSLNGNLEYTVKWKFSYDLRDELFPDIMFFRVRGADDIGITNGQNYAIFEADAGELIETDIEE